MNMQAYGCIGTQCVLLQEPGSGAMFNTTTCDFRCMNDGRSVLSLAPLAFERLPLGAVAPTGWLREQLSVQLFGLSGHLQRFWPDVANSTWIFPDGEWKETYSDRGGNLPYWLNGVIPLAFQLRDHADAVDSSGYNLTHVIVTYMHTRSPTSAPAGTGRTA